MKTTEVGGEQGFDSGKKVHGRKRHILLDTMGNLLKVLSHAANIGECAGAEKLGLSVPEKLWTRLKKLLADGGYEGADFQDWVEQTFPIEFEISLRPRDKKRVGLVPIRWVVEKNICLPWSLSSALQGLRTLNRKQPGHGLLSFHQPFALAPCSYFILKYALLSKPEPLGWINIETSTAIRVTNSWVETSVAETQIASTATTKAPF